ncbi:YfiR family protein [bacterium]|nr:YfiR family protein [bacterium]
MNRLLKLTLSVLIVAAGVFVPVSLTPQTDDAPVSLAAALTIKLAAFEKNISSGETVAIHVLGSPEMADELKKGIGTSIGSAKIESVTQGDSLPVNAPQILYVGQEADVERAIRYTRLHKILSISGKQNLVSKGITLVIGVGGDGKPMIKLNLTSTIEEGLNWNPAIMKIAKTVK